MENVRFLQGVKQYFCTKALDVILLIYLLLGFILLPYKYLWKDIVLSLCKIEIWDEEAYGKRNIFRIGCKNDGLYIFM